MRDEKKGGDRVWNIYRRDVLCNYQPLCPNLVASRRSLQPFVGPTTYYVHCDFFFFNDSNFLLLCTDVFRYTQQQLGVIFECREAAAPRRAHKPQTGYVRTRYSILKYHN